MTSEALDDKERWKQWEGGMAEQIVESVNTLRERSGLTIRDLAEQLEKFGWPVSTNTLTGILSGRKRSSFSLGEILAFAETLGVPALFLILGLPAATGYATAPGQESVPNTDRLASFTGGLPAPRYEEDPAWDPAESLSILLAYRTYLLFLRQQNAVALLQAEHQKKYGDTEGFPTHLLRVKEMNESLDEMWAFLMRQSDLGAMGISLPVPAGLESLRSTDFDARKFPLPVQDVSSASDLAEVRARVNQEIEAMKRWLPRTHRKERIDGK